MIRSPGRKLMILCLCFAVIFTILNAQDRRSFQKSKITIGEFPPDFDLPLLTFSKDKKGEPIGVMDLKRTFKLSDYRGKKPVCMIMSSYT